MSAALARDRPIVGGWASLGVNGLVSIALPVAVSVGVASLVRRCLPPNPFAFILGAGFAGALAMAAVGIASTGLLLATSAESADMVVDHYAVVFFLLLLYPEAFVTGAITPWLVMFHPAPVRGYGAPYPVHE